MHDFHHFWHNKMYGFIISGQAISNEYKIPLVIIIKLLQLYINLAHCGPTLLDRGGGHKDLQLSKLLNALKQVFKGGQNVFVFSNDDFRKIFDQDIKGFKFNKKHFQNFSFFRPVNEKRRKLVGFQDFFDFFSYMVNKYPLILYVVQH